MIKVGITHGDINGIGYEVILKTFSDIRMTELCIPVIYGSSKVAGYHRKALDMPVVTFNQINSAKDVATDKVNIINCVDEDVRVELGTSTDVAGVAALQALERACEDLENGLIDVLVTAPINKQNINQGDSNFIGYAEYLEARFGVEGQKSLMILAKENLRVALATGNLPLAEVSENLTKEKLQKAIQAFDVSLKRDFRLESPRIAVLSLNPYAEDNTKLGKEEEEIIKPALKELQDKNVLCFGPYAADGFFGSREYTKFDGVLAMYHDQGMAPFKSLAENEGAIFTTGLSIIRTAPTHGTEYAMAGKNEASEDSFRQAIYMAVDNYINRVEYDKAFENPIRKLYVERGGDNEVLDLTKEA